MWTLHHETQYCTSELRWVWSRHLIRETDFYIFSLVSPLAGSKQSRRKCLTLWCKGIPRKTLWKDQRVKSACKDTGKSRREIVTIHLWLATQNHRNFCLSLCTIFLFPYYIWSGSPRQLVVKIKSLPLKNPASWMLSVAESPREIKCLIIVPPAFQRRGFACSGICLCWVLWVGFPLPAGAVSALTPT